ncbi:ArsR/SmtB family transcription factor [Devosia elaeis]|uniref:HTH arsR-type domain-containing protein n=1 Tax=Devosia elaeis TaxID=1770058 RepID=A0A178HWE4_9HYPH|nr:metalloregulator ArsR/SmtB family transcription factor [Devosia elaeis]OAM76374.1 hypothetical protein A3840_12715 [Devosia elaeis]
MTRKIKPPVILYSALADTTRCRIIEILADGPIPVHRLADSFTISRPAISRHLRVLKEAGLVAEVKKGRENLYAFRARKLNKALGWIEAFSAAEREADRVEENGEAELAAPIMVQPPESAIILPPAAIETVAAAPDEPAPARKRAKPAAPAPEKAATQMGFDF